MAQSHFCCLKQQIQGAHTSFIKANVFVGVQPSTFSLSQV